MKLWAAIIALTALLASCADSGDFSHFSTLPDSGWAYGDTIGFDTDRLDSLSTGTLYLSLRHTNDYHYSNLWIEVTCDDNGRQRRDTLNLRLADNFGRWQGKGFGATRQMKTEVARNITPRPGSKVWVRHIMRVDTLCGIREIGVSFNKK